MTWRCSPRWRTALLIAILMLAAALRFYRLGAQSLWNDEGTSVALAQRSLGTITRNAAHDIHPPLYYYLLHYCVAALGTSEFAVRSLSALAGVATVLATHLLGRRLLDEETVLLGCLLMALSPLQVYYAQETRMYALVGLWGALSTWALVAYLRADDDFGRFPWRPAAAYLLTGGAAVYTHYFGFTLLLAHSLYVASRLVRQCAANLPWRQRLARLLRWAALPAIIAFAYVPWLALSWRSLTSWPAVGEDLSLVAMLRSFTRVLALGVTVADSAGTRWIVAGLCTVPLIGLAVGLFAQAGVASNQRRRGAGLILAYLAVPLVVVVALSFVRPMYKAKFLVLLSPAFAIATAMGIVAIARGVGTFARREAVRVASVVALTALVVTPMGLSLKGLYYDGRYARDDYRGIAQYIEATSGPSDAIIINAPSQIETVDYYYHGDLAQYPLPRRRPMDEAETESELSAILANHPRIYAILWATAESDPDGYVEGWLDQHAFKSLNSWYGNLRLAVYSAPAAPAVGIQRPTDYVLGDGIRLLGYSLLTPSPASGDIVQLALFWQVDATPQRRYKVFVHLVDARGNIVGQRDSEPAGGGRLTTTWQPAEVIADNYGLPIPPGSPPGTYTVRLGMYTVDGGERLPIAAGAQPVGDAIDLLTVGVESASAPPPLSAMDIETPHDAVLDGLKLLGHSLRRLGHEHEPLALRPADTAKLTLFWERLGTPTVGDEVTLVLMGRRQERAYEQRITILGGTYPPADWSPGERIRDIERLELPPTLTEGTYDLVIEASGPDGGEALLQKVTIGP